MKRLSLTRNLRVPRHAPYLCASPPDRSLLSAHSTTLFEVLFRLSRPFRAQCHVWRAAAQPRRSEQVRRVHEHGVFARFRYNDLKEADRGCGGRGHYANSMVGRSGVEVRLAVRGGTVFS
jgi:hypothetical protein